MKAIGMRISDIKSIYLTTYAALGAAGCILGFSLSLCFYEPMLAGIRLNFGKGRNGGAAIFSGIISVVFLFAFILFYVNWNLGRFRKISATEAIRFGMGEKIVAMAISSFGVAAFQFVVNVPATFLICPLLLLFTTMIAVTIGTGKIGQINLAASMKE